MKENNDELRQLFDDYQPALSSERDFMDALNERLNAVEYIRQQQEKQLRLYRYAIVAALVLGLMCGGVLAVAVMMTADAGPLFTFDVSIAPLVFLQDYSRTLVLIAIASLMTCGIVALIRNLQSSAIQL